MAHIETCEDYWDLLSAYADDAISPLEATRVETHVAACSDCARDLRFMRETAFVLAATPEVAPPSTLRASILAATIYRPTWQQRLSAALRWFVPSVPYRALAFAGSAAVLLLA